MMFSGQPNSSDTNKDYDFSKEENAAKWHGILLNSLKKVLEQVHPSLSAQEDALLYVESLCLRLLSMLCAEPSPRTKEDIAERVRKTFPNPIENWALREAREAVEKPKKKKSVLPVDKIHIMIKDAFQYKIDLPVCTFMVAVLEYISADILKLAGNYVKNIRHVEISREDIEIAMCADKVLMDMFYQGESGNVVTASPLPPTPRNTLSYDDVVKELIHEEKQYQRELHMIIRVFREELVKIVKDPKDLDPIFSNIIEIYELTVTLLGSLEDVIEMSQDQPPFIGNCFEELAEALEFEVYIKYAKDVTSTQSKEALQRLLATQDSTKLITACHGFREAVKYYLPKLLLGPIWHAFLYLEYVKILLQLSPNKEDKESFEQVQGLLKPLQNELQNIVAYLPKDSMAQALSRTRRQLAIDKIKELQNSVSNWDKDIVGTNCSEFIRVDTLHLGSSKRVTERKVYLFDGLLVLFKINARRQGVTVGNTNYEMRQKEKFQIRLVEIIDRFDSDEQKHAFEIAPRDRNQAIVLVAKSVEQKNDWMADLMMVTTKSMLDRILDSILLDIEKKHPLRLPSPEIYKFSAPDSSSNIVLEERESAGVPLIKGATLCKLIERLTYHIYADPMFVRTFLTTYRSFCSPQELLQLLIERFDIPDPSLVYESVCDKDLETDKIHKNLQREDWKRYKKEYVQPVQFRVLNVLRHWVDHHFYDFENDPELLEKLLIFLETVNGMRKWVDSVLKIVQRKKEQEDNHKKIMFAIGHSPPAIEYHLQVPETEVNLLTLHPLELGRQLTLLEFELYKTVKPSELVGSVWTKKDKETKSPNLLKIIKHTTNFSRWLEKSIIDSENLEERVAMLSRAIEVMMVLLELNNFNGVITIAFAIGSAAIHRLKFTLAEISARHRTCLDECIELTQNHFRKYQEKLRSINPPCVPFFGIYLTNILHIEEGNLDFLPNSDLINFSKRRKVAEITGEIQQYQNQPYCLKVDDNIRNFLENLDPFKGKSVAEITDILYKESERIEPRDCTQKQQPLPKFPRKWPDLNLKSPGIKPRRHNQSSNSMSMPGTLPFSTKSLHIKTSTGEQSPPGNNNNSSSSSAQDFSVFANVNIQGSSASLLSQSQVNLATNANDYADTIPLPQIPKRSNSIISLANNYSTDTKPILSPRISDNIGGCAVTTVFRHQPIVSPKCLEPLPEEFSCLNTIDNNTIGAIGGISDNANNIPPTISPRTDKLCTSSYHHNVTNTSTDTNVISANRSPFQNTSQQQQQQSRYNVNVRNSTYSISSNYDDNASANDLPHSRSVFSPNAHNQSNTNASSNNCSDSSAIAGALAGIGPIPISPHVNVPHTNTFNHVAPPPLPPRRRERKEIETIFIAQNRQAPDAPQLPPRDLSPPPLPPRLSVKMETFEEFKDVDFKENGLEKIHTSTIMKRRSSAMERKSKDSLMAGSSSGSNLSGQQFSSLDNHIMSTTGKQQNFSSTAAPPVARRPSTSISPRSSGETTPKLPPKPKNTNLFSHSNTDRTTMFPYPSTNHE